MEGRRRFEIVSWLGGGAGLVLVSMCGITRSSPASGSPYWVMIFTSAQVSVPAAPS